MKSQNSNLTKFCSYNVFLKTLNSIFKGSSRKKESSKIKRNFSDPVKHENEYSDYDDSLSVSSRFRRQFEDDDGLQQADLHVQHPAQLSDRQKMTIRVIRKIKYFVARRKFQVTRQFIY